MQRRVLVCQHTSCTEAGSQNIFNAFQEAQLPKDVEIVEVGCQGQCSIAPTVRILPEEIWYYRVQTRDIPLIVEQHLKNGQPVESKLNPRIHRYFG